MRIVRFAPSLLSMALLMAGCSQHGAQASAMVSSTTEAAAAAQPKTDAAPTLSDADKSLTVSNTFGVVDDGSCLVAAASAGSLPGMAFATYLHPQSYEQTADPFKHKDQGAAATNEATALVQKTNPSGTRYFNIVFSDPHPLGTYTHSEVANASGFSITAGMDQVAFSRAQGYSCWVRWKNSHDIPGGFIPVPDEATARAISDAMDKGTARIRVLARADDWTPLSQDEAAQRDYHLMVGASILHVQIITTDGAVLVDQLVVPKAPTKLRPGEVTF